MGRVTIRDVAERAGVSTATVSRALSGARPVSPTVHEQVTRAADDLGYSGNGIASALRRSRTDTVGMVVPSIANPFFTALVDWVEKAEAPGDILLTSRDKSISYPICVYPLKTTWNGSGPVTQAASFSCR